MVTRPEGDALPVATPPPAMHTPLTVSEVASALRTVLGTTQAPVVSLTMLVSVPQLASE